MFVSWFHNNQTLLPVWRTFAQQYLFRQGDFNYIKDNDEVVIIVDPKIISKKSFTKAKFNLQYHVTNYNLSNLNNDYFIEAIFPEYLPFLSKEGIFWKNVVISRWIEASN